MRHAGQRQGPERLLGTLGNAQVSQSNVGSFVAADLNNAVAVLDDSGFTQLSDSYDFAAMVLSKQQFDANIETYQYCANPADVAGFDSIHRAFTEQALALPEPQSWALLLAGVGLVGTLARRRRR